MPFLLTGLLFTLALYAAGHFVWAVPGRFRSTGAKPKSMGRLKACGIHLSESIFREVHEVK